MLEQLAAGLYVLGLVATVVALAAAVLLFAPSILKGPGARI